MESCELQRKTTITNADTRIDDMPNKLNALTRSLLFFLQLVFAQLLTVEFAFAAPHSGDIDGNGDIDNDDLQLLQQFLGGSTTLTNDEKTRGDVNDTGDAVIDNSDYLLLQQIVQDGHATHSGLKASQLGLLINDNDPYSVTIGEYYRTRRGIPSANIVHLNIPLGVIELSRANFALLKAAVDAALPATVQVLAIAWTLPSRIECNSVTSAFARGFIAEPCPTDNFFSEPVSPYYNSVSTQPFTDFQIRPAMMLAALSVDDAKALIDRGIASDGSRPSGRAYLMSTSDDIRSLRALASGIGLGSLDLANLGTALSPYVNAQVVSSNAISGTTDALFYFQGLTNVFNIATNTFPPGAVADHLTSYGGMLTDAEANGQMSALQFIKGGATGTFGTASEPTASNKKFPDPARMIMNYTRGDTLIEAYWKSVAMTARGVFVGEPLANPWPRNIRSCAAGLDAVCAEKWSQTISVLTTTPSSAAFNSKFIVRVHASSGLPVTITAADGCSGAGFDNATITMTSGTVSCTLNYAQAGNAGYAAAPPASSVISFSDLDHDGVADVIDAFPTHEAASIDVDSDGKPDSWNAGCDATCQSNSGLTLDTDFDNDGVLNAADNCLHTANTDQLNTDSDDQGDACDLDDDNDDTADTLDAFPIDKAVSVDSDHDGKPDDWNAGCNAACQSGSGLTLDSDDDNDGWSDQEESALGSSPLNRLDPVRAFIASGSVLGANYVIGMDDAQWQTSEYPNSFIWSSENGGYGGSFFYVTKATQEVILGDASFCVLNGNRAQCLGDFSVDIADVSVLAGHRVAVPLGSDYNCVIAAGAVQCWINQDGGTVHAISAANTALLSSATQLAVGLTTSCAANGSTAYCWNNADETEVYFTEILAAGLAAPTAITVGDQHVCAIDNGSVKCWGEAANGKTAPGVITSALRIAAGSNHTCALTGNYATPASLAIQCWEDNGVYQTAVPSALKMAGAAVPVDVRASGNETCAVVAGSDHADSAIECWPIGLNGLNSGAKDSDGDGLTDAEETDGSRSYITNPQLADTDGDGLNDNMDASPAQAQIITVTKKGAVLAIYGSSVAVAASANSGLPVTIIGSGGCAGGGTGTATLIMTSGSAACTVSYSQAGNARYAAAPMLSGVTNAFRALNSIAITSAAPGSAAYGSSFTVAATAQSGLPVAITTSGGCSITGGTVTMTSGSTACVINYDQAISANYIAAARKSSTTTASAASQTITITNRGPAIAAYGSTFVVAASASSGLPVAISGGGGCSGAGAGTATMTMTSVSTPCTVSYSQAGNGDYAAVPALPSITYGMRQLNQITVTTAAPGSAPYGSSFAVAATATSGLPVAITTAGGCSITADTVTMTSGSTACTVYYDQAISANYTAAARKSNTTTATP
jgi:uncharacterized protein (TIGR03790 family)